MERKVPLSIRHEKELRWGWSHRASSVRIIKDAKNFKSPPTEVHTVADYNIIS